MKIISLKVQNVIINKKVQELEEEHKKFWKYPERSCISCIKYPCFVGQENSTADYAKYGCIKFSDDSTAL